MPAPVLSRSLPLFSSLLPPLASLLERRVWAAWIGAFGVGYLFLESQGMGGGCMMRDFTGVRCPGCGLTAAARHAAHGEWGASLVSHAFLALFAAAFILVVLAGVLPSRIRQPFIAGLRRWEERIALTTILAGAFVVYWLARLLLGSTG